MERLGKRIFLVTFLLMPMFYLVMQLSVASAADVTVLRFAGFYPINHYMTQSMELYAKHVMEKTNKVKIEVYPAGQLFSDKDLVRALPEGAIEMGVMHSGLVSGSIPSVSFMEFPFLHKDHAHWLRVLDSKVGDIVKQDFEKKGMQFLYWLDIGRNIFVSRRPLKTLEDFKGKRIRASGVMQVEAIRALGAAPTILGTAEVYMALQRNTIDGSVTGISGAWERKYYEASKYVTDAQFHYGAFPVVMNKKIWDGLPRDIQAIMLEATKEVQTWGRKEAEKVDNEAIEQLKQKGMEYNSVPEKERDRWKDVTIKVCREAFLQRVGDQDKGKTILEIAEKLR
jgi:tripartite ATP-independent transporter DctP family solute receptor